jgi:hypothetical protein
VAGVWKKTQVLILRRYASDIIVCKVCEIHELLQTEDVHTINPSKNGELVMDWGTIKQNTVVCTECNRV